MIFDTDILIWVQRGVNGAANLINDADKRRISIISYMEFIQAAKNKKMLSICKNFLGNLDLEIIPISPDISHRAAVFIEEFSLSHGLSIADALIAATAFEYGEPLATSNYKDYKMIAGLEIKRLHVRQ
ncbi:MAG: type II toxin-antitoxin system VapC family toxin [Rickettsiales bacterium]